VSAAFRAEPGLELSRDDIQRLTELEPAETDVVIEALADAGVVVPDHSRVRAGETPAREPAPGGRPSRDDSWRRPSTPNHRGGGK
jgi:hypothetical protein